MVLQRSGAEGDGQLVRTITAPENHANGRHHLDGSLPSGKSRII
jgi:hypothetical protein